MAGREARPVAAALASPIAGYDELSLLLRLVLASRSGDGVRLWPAGTCFCLWLVHRPKSAATKHSLTLGATHNSLAALKLLYRSATASLVRIRAPAAADSIKHRESFSLQTRPCMLSRGLASHTKRPRPTAIAADAYRSVVCTYFCASLLVRVLATILETCSLSELLKGRALRAVPSLGTASYKTCHKHGAGRRH